MEVLAVDTETTGHVVPTLVGRGVRSRRPVV